MKLSGPQVQALVWVAFKDVERPPMRALNQIVRLGLVKPPVPGHDPHYRPLDAAFAELRARGLDRGRPGKKTALMPREAREGARAA